MHPKSVYLLGCISHLKLVAVRELSAKFYGTFCRKGF